jgi:2-methylaconitate cis-trans-isomerase PrpF
MNSLPVMLMRGGTSRGPVLHAADLPSDPAARDELLISLIGRGRTQLDGVGGGSPTTSKVVLVAPAPDDPDVDLQYLVGNVVVGSDRIDYAGTCGNMTATVPLFAVLHGWTSRGETGAYRLRNLSTGQIVDARLAVPGADAEAASAPGGIAVSTRYLDPAGASLGSALPTGSPLDVLECDGARFRSSIIDVSHPYLFLEEQVVRTRGRGDVERLVRRLRALACERLGVMDAGADADLVSPAVPRVVLVHPSSPADEADGILRVTAVSMGTAIPSVPVTAAMCAAAGTAISGTLLHRSASSDVRLRVIGPASEVIARAELTTDGCVLATAVERTARLILRGEAFVAD